MPYFDRFDICEAAYLWAGDYNVGGFAALPGDKQRRDIYGRLSRMQFRPSPLMSYESLSDNGRDWYDKWASEEESK